MSFVPQEQQSERERMHARPSESDARKTVEDVEDSICYFFLGPQCVGKECVRFPTNQHGKLTAATRGGRTTRQARRTQVAESYNLVPFPTHFRIIWEAP